MTLHRFKVTVTSMTEAEQLEASIEDLLISSNVFLDDETGTYKFEGLFQIENQPEIVARLSLYATTHNLQEAPHIEPVENKNWLELIAQTFPPIEVGQFYVYGSHIKSAPPQGTIPILMNAGMAFGTGDHATTQGCLQAIWDLYENGFGPHHILDVGTGTGILSIGAQKVWPQAKVLASDIDEASVSIAKENAAQNNVAHIHMMHADGLDNSEIQHAAPYDLIMANILAKPLISLSDDIINAVRAEGYIILSGLITSQRDEVLTAYLEKGCELKQEHVLGNWVTLHLQKRH